jgi:biotin synthase-like enzyme
MNMKVTGLKENSEDDTKWFINNPSGDDIPFYTFNKNKGVIFINNLKKNI